MDQANAAMSSTLRRHKGIIFNMSHNLTESFQLILLGDITVYSNISYIWVVRGDIDNVGEGRYEQPHCDGRGKGWGRSAYLEIRENRVCGDKIEVLRAQRRSRNDNALSWMSSLLD